MSRSRNRAPLLGALLALGVVAAIASAMQGSFAAEARDAADHVTLADGSELAGRVVSLDAHVLVVEVDGARRTIRRREVRRIELGDAPPPPLVARVKVAEADDEVRLLLDGEEIAPPAQLRAEWFDLMTLLDDGPHHLTAEVVNQRGMRAWRWVLEVGGTKETFACGLTGRSGCTADGKPADAQGTFPAGGVWLHVRLSEGLIELERDPAPEPPPGPSPVRAPRR
jgi:hypothetical protein